MGSSPPPAKIIPFLGGSDKPTPPLPPPTGEGRKWWPLTLVFLILAAFYLGMANPEFRFMEGASAIKLLHARSLLAGLGYRDIGRLGMPPEIVRPPGFPALLAGIMFFVGEDFLVLKLVNNLFAALAAVPLFFLFLQRTGERRLASALTLAGLLFPGLYFIARYLEAELLFCFLFFSAIAFFERAHDRGSPLLLFGFLLSMGLACLVRTAGVVLVPAALLTLLLANSLPTRHRRVWAIWILVGWVLTGGAWMVRNQIKAPPGEMTYLDKLLADVPVESVYWLLEDQRIPLLPPPKRASVIAIAKRTLANAPFLLRQFASALFPPAERGSWQLVLMVAGLPGLFILYGFLRGFLQKRRLVDAVTLFYLPMILVWPYQDTRFLLPVVPFLLLYLIEGVPGVFEALTKTEKAKSSRLLALGLASVLSLIFGVQDGRHLLQTKEPSSLPVLERTPHFRITSPHLGAYHSLLLLEWVAEHSQPADVVMFHAYAPCAFLTGRFCTAPPLVGPDRVLEYIDEVGVDFVVVDDEVNFGPAYTSAFTPEYLVPVIKKFPQRFQLAYTVGANARVFRVLRK